LTPLVNATTLTGAMTALKKLATLQSSVMMQLPVMVALTEELATHLREHATVLLMMVENTQAIPIKLHTGTTANINTAPRIVNLEETVTGILEYAVATQGSQANPAKSMNALTTATNMESATTLMGPVSATMGTLAMTVHLRSARETVGLTEGVTFQPENAHVTTTFTETTACSLLVQEVAVQTVFVTLTAEGAIVTTVTEELTVALTLAVNLLVTNHNFYKLRVVNVAFSVWFSQTNDSLYFFFC